MTLREYVRSPAFIRLARGDGVAWKVRMESFRGLMRGLLVLTILAVAAPAFADERAVLARATLEAGLRLRPVSVDPLWGLEPQRRNLAAELQAARAAGRVDAWLADLAPADPRYVSLLAARAPYAQMVAAGGWSPLPEGPTLRLGDSHHSVGNLRQRMVAEGYGQADDLGDPRMDERLVAAVVRFQSLHGLESDGVVGPETRAALNVPAAVRLAQLDANLERWRWTPQRLPPDRLEVDVGTAQATLFEANAPVLTMRVVVGDLNHKTPMFASRLESVVINPPWNVPGSIASAELLPKEARSPGYLARNGFRFVEGRLQQRPGPANALGRLKFDLPSPYGVYLHDTPARSAFARRNRTLSHGCMRLEAPLELAARLLGPQGWTPSKIETAIANGTTQRVELRAPLPLFVVYRTAFVDAVGLNLWPDRYGWDSALTRALDGRVVGEIATGATECAAGDATGPAL